MPSHGSNHVVSICASLVALAPAAAAQTLYALDGGANVSAEARAWEFTLSSGGACPAPLPQLNSWLIKQTIAGCQFPPGSFCPPDPASGCTPANADQGGMTVDRTNDVVWVTSGFSVQRYADRDPSSGVIAGTPLDSHTPDEATSGLVPPLTGIAVDPSGVGPGIPLLWLTDGDLIAAVELPDPPCSALRFETVEPGFAVQGLPAGATLTGLARDPENGTLWACDDTGLVHNFFLNPGGAPTALGSIQVGLPGGNPAFCGLTDSLQGIAVDASVQDEQTGFDTPPTLYVTDGFVVARVEILAGAPAVAAPATPTFYAPETCTSVPTPNAASGLPTRDTVCASASRSPTWGSSTSPPGGTAPRPRTATAGASRATRLRPRTRRPCCSSRSARTIP